MDESASAMDSHRDNLDWISLDDMSNSVAMPDAADHAQEVALLDHHEDYGASSDGHNSEDRPDEHTPQLGVPFTNHVEYEDGPCSQSDTVSLLDQEHPSPEATSQNSLRTPDDEGILRSDTPKWAPFYVRPPFLLGQAIVFILVITALEVLYHVSEKNQGLATVPQNLHYLWTYGPTFGA